MYEKVATKLLEVVDANGKHEPFYIEVPVSEEISEETKRSILSMLHIE